MAELNSALYFLGIIDFTFIHEKSLPVTQIFFREMRSQLLCLRFLKAHLLYNRRHSPLLRLLPQQIGSCSAGRMRHFIAQWTPIVRGEMR